MPVEHPPPKSKNPVGGNRQGSKENQIPLEKESDMTNMDHSSEKFNTPVIFSFENQNVRTITIDDAPWFVAADVCRVLDLSNPTKALLALDEDEKALTSIQGISRGNDQANIINESGLYTLILRCRDATTPGTVPHRFRKWLTSEVLPSIRKTGEYQGAKADTPKPALSTPKEARLMFAMARSIGKMVGLEGNELAIRANRVTKKNTGIDFLGDMGVTATGTPSPVNDSYLTPTEIGHALGGLSGRATNKELEKAGYQVRFEDQWTPTEKGKLAGGRFFDRERSNGTGSVQQLKWPSNMVKVLRSLSVTGVAI